MKLRIDLRQAGFVPGDRVAGEVVVLEGGRSRRATIELRFVERSRRFEHVAYSSGPATLADEELATGDVLAFELVLPERAPPSVYTEYASLLWELLATVDVPLLPDHKERLEIIVAS